MRTIDPSPFAAYVGQPTSASLGVRPELAWLPISNLRIDERYQREVLRNGSRNIGKIARNFDWSKFGIVVVARLTDGLFAIVDGQHRTIAAAARQILEVPCVIIDADPAQQAAAFAEINGSVTAISKLAIFAAEVAAGNPSALDLSKACSSAGVSVCRYPVAANNMKPGETIAIGALQDNFKTYGPQHLTLALSAIMSSVGKTPGMVKAQIIKATCHVLEAEQTYRRSERRLLLSMERYDFAGELAKAEIEARTKKTGVHTALSVRLFDYLDREMAA